MKTQTLLRMQSNNGAMVEYDDLDHDLLSHTFVAISHLAWEQIGSPSMVTVTVEAGDALN